MNPSTERRPVCQPVERIPEADSRTHLIDTHECDPPGVESSSKYRSECLFQPMYYIKQERPGSQPTRTERTDPRTCWIENHDSDLSFGVVNSTFRPTPGNSDCQTAERIQEISPRTYLIEHHCSDQPVDQI